MLVAAFREGRASEGEAEVVSGTRGLDDSARGRYASASFAEEMKSVGCEHCASRWIGPTPHARSDFDGALPVLPGTPHSRDSHRGGSSSCRADSTKPAQAGDRNCAPGPRAAAKICETGEREGPAATRRI